MIVLIEFIEINSIIKTISKTIYSWKFEYDKNWIKRIDYKK